MLPLLEMNYLSIERMDKRVWKPDSRGHFSVQSFYNVLINSYGRVEGGHRRTVFKIPFVSPRV